MDAAAVVVLSSSFFLSFFPPIDGLRFSILLLHSPVSQSSTLTISTLLFDKIDDPSLWLVVVVYACVWEMMRSSRSRYIIISLHPLARLFSTMNHWFLSTSFYFQILVAHFSPFHPNRYGFRKSNEIWFEIPNSNKCEWCDYIDYFLFIGLDFSWDLSSVCNPFTLQYDIIWWQFSAGCRKFDKFLY